MRYRMRCQSSVLILVCFCFGLLEAFSFISLKVTAADNPASANSHPIYQELRHVGLSGHAATVSNLVLKRDAGTFTFKSGNLYFLSPVSGKVTGAVFLGEGSFTMTPPIEVEKRNLALLTKEPRITEEFNQLVMRFTDDTLTEIERQTSITPSAPNNRAADLLEDNQKNLRRKLRYNLTGRILQDVLSDQAGGFFAAFIKGRKYGELQYSIDPFGNRLTGSLSVAPEEVSLSSYEENRYGIWAAFHLEQEYAAKRATSAEQNYPIDVEHQQLDTQIEKNGNLHGQARTTFISKWNGLRVVPLKLFPTLRVQSVTDSDGQALAFIQESKDEDSQFFVIMPRNLKDGERFTIKTIYNGPDVVANQGSGNYYVTSSARDEWYPATHLGDSASYDLTFRIPKGLTMVATGIPVSEATEGVQNVSVWRSEVPYIVAGFNFGRFKKEVARNERLGFTFESYDFADGADEKDLYYKNAEGKTAKTTVMKKALAEAKVALEIYTDYFGPSPYTRIAMTQHSAVSYGQSWPSLTFLPQSAFSFPFGAIGILGYFRVVGPHEIAHQWWGHAVGWNSYRDQWISEGFSDFAASLFIQATYAQQNQDRFFQFWKDEKELLTEKNDRGVRAIDIGPLTLGYRLSTRKAGFDIGRRLIYPKGAFVLHMLRMLMWDNKTKDDRFKVMMRDFVRTHLNKVATTEDFKVIVEKHITPDMDLQGNGKMDWFFDQFVYGTALPHYKLNYSLGQDASGQVMLNIRIEQSNVDDDFVMRMPVYLEFKGVVTRLGTIAIQGNKVFEQSVPITNLANKPQRVALNYYYDVLCTQ